MLHIKPQHKQVPLQTDRLCMWCPVHGQVGGENKWHNFRTGLGWRKKNSKEKNISSVGCSAFSKILLLKVFLFKENLGNLLLWFSAHEDTAGYVGRVMFVFPGNLKCILTEQLARVL